MLKSFAPLAFILLWILPVAWVGLVRSSFPLYPAAMAPLFRVSGVFEASPQQWRTFFLETESEKGSWEYLDERTLFAATPLGNRTRFQPLMAELMLPRSSSQVHGLLLWVARSTPKRNLQAVRIIFFKIPNETFLTQSSLGDVYKNAVETGLGRTIVDTLNLPL